MPDWINVSYGCDVTSCSLISELNGIMVYLMTLHVAILSIGDFLIRPASLETEALRWMI